MIRFLSGTWPLHTCSAIQAQTPTKILIHSAFCIKLPSIFVFKTERQQTLLASLILSWTPLSLLHAQEKGGKMISWFLTTEMTWNVLSGQSTELECTIPEVYRYTKRVSTATPSDPTHFMSDPPIPLSTKGVDQHERRWLPCLQSLKCFYKRLEHATRNNAIATLYLI